MAFWRGRPADSRHPRRPALGACGKTQIVIVQRGQRVEDGTKILNDILDGGPVLRFFDTPYGLLAVGQGSAGIVNARSEEALPPSIASVALTCGGRRPVRAAPRRQSRVNPAMMLSSMPTPSGPDQALPR